MSLIPLYDDSKILVFDTVAEIASSNASAESDGVTGAAACEVSDGIQAIIQIIDISVYAIVAAEVIVTGAADNIVIAFTTKYGVIAGTAVDDVITIVTVNGVIAITAINGIISGATCNIVITTISINGISKISTNYCI